MRDETRPFLEEGVRQYGDAKDTVATFELYRGPSQSGFFAVYCRAPNNSPFVAREPGFHFRGGIYHHCRAGRKQEKGRFLFFLRSAHEGLLLSSLVEDLCPAVATIDYVIAKISTRSG